VIVLEKTAPAVELRENQEVETMDEGILADAALRYGVSVRQLKPIAGGNFNHVFEVPAGEGNHILRLMPPNEQLDLASIQAVMEWMAYLAGHGAPVPAPVRSAGGRLVEQAGPGGATLVTAVRKSNGVRGETLPFECWDDRLFTALGRAAGKLHALAKEYSPPAALQRPDWEAAGNCYNPEEPADPAAAWVWELRKQVLESIRRLPKDRDSYGLIHADLHGGNFFVDVPSGAITVFDFDDCVHGWFVMDLAMSLFDMLVLYPGADRAGFAARFLKCLLSGYLSENFLSAYWIKQLPSFLKLLEIGIYLMVYQDADPDDRESWVGKFMQGRKERMQAGLPYVELDFAAYP
jgi:Ser/Thr protein kinase RdoA (MazF antagonist)